MFIATWKTYRYVILKPEFARDIFSKFSFSKCKHSTRICKYKTVFILQIEPWCLLWKHIFLLHVYKPFPPRQLWLWLNIISALPSLTLIQSYSSAFTLCVSSVMANSSVCYSFSELREVDTVTRKGITHYKLFCCHWVDSQFLDELVQFLPSTPSGKAS